MKQLLRIILTAAIILNSSVVSAQDENDQDFWLGAALAKLRKKELPASVEVRFNEPEFIFRYKQFSLDYSHFDAGMHYLKLNVDNEIISMMGTGVNWSYGLTSIDWKDKTFAQDAVHNFVPVPTVGINLYMAIMPKMKIYAQFSGMIMGGYGHVYDTESGIRYSPSKNFTITAGYRHVTANVKHKNNRGDFKMTGPFIGMRSDF